MSMLITNLFIDGVVSGCVYYMTILEARKSFSGDGKFILLWYLISNFLIYNIFELQKRYKYDIQLHRHTLKFFLFICITVIPICFTVMRTAVGLVFLVTTCSFVHIICYFKTYDRNRKKKPQCDVSGVDYLAYMIGILISGLLTRTVSFGIFGRLIVFSSYTLVILIVIYFDALDILLRSHNSWLRYSLSSMLVSTSRSMTLPSASSAVSLTELEEAQTLINENFDVGECDDFKGSVSNTSSKLQDTPISNRFIRGCNGDMVEASKRWQSTCRWRAEKHIDDILQCNAYSSPIIHNILAIKDCYPHAFHGRANDSAKTLVYYERLGKINIKRLMEEYRISTELLLQYNIFMQEYIWCRLQTDDDAKMITVLDVEGIKMSDMMGDTLDYIKKSIQTIQAHYVDRCYKMYIVNAPFYFNMLWNMISPLLNETTRNKVSILNSYSTKGALLENIDVENIPFEYSGDSRSLKLGFSSEELAYRAFIDKLLNSKEQGGLGAAGGSSSNLDAAGEGCQLDSHTQCVEADNVNDPANATNSTAVGLGDARTTDSSPTSVSTSASGLRSWVVDLWNNNADTIEMTANAISQVSNTTVSTAMDVSGFISGRVTSMITATSDGSGGPNDLGELGHKIQSSVSKVIKQAYLGKSNRYVYNKQKQRWELERFVADSTIEDDEDDDSEDLSDCTSSDSSECSEYSDSDGDIESVHAPQDGGKRMHALGNGIHLFVDSDGEEEELDTVETGKRIGSITPRKKLPKTSMKQLSHVAKTPKRSPRHPRVATDTDLGGVHPHHSNYSGPDYSISSRAGMLKPNQLHNSRSGDQHGQSRKDIDTCCATFYNLILVLLDYLQFTCLNLGLYLKQHLILFLQSEYLKNVFARFGYTFQYIRMHYELICFYMLWSFIVSCIMYYIPVYMARRVSCYGLGLSPAGIGRIVICCSALVILLLLYGTKKSIGHQQSSASTPSKAITDDVYASDKYFFIQLKGLRAAAVTHICCLCGVCTLIFEMYDGSSSGSSTGGSSFLGITLQSLVLITTLAASYSVYILCQLGIHRMISMIANTLPNGSTSQGSHRTETNTQDEDEIIIVDDSHYHHNAYILQSLMQVADIMGLLVGVMWNPLVLLVYMYSGLVTPAKGTSVEYCDSDIIAALPLVLCTACYIWLYYKSMKLPNKYAMINLLEIA